MSVIRASRPTVLRLAVLATALALLTACAGGPVPPAAVESRAAARVSAPAPTSPDKVTVAFEPFTGAPGNIADDLARKIGNEARVQNLKLVRRVGAPATYRVKGYLAASGDQSSTTMFYVFDVVDTSDTRVHRIVGQESAPGSSGDPWSGPNSDTLERAARRAVTELVAWIRR